MQAPRWDLSKIYQSVLDPQIDADIKLAMDKAFNFQKKYKGTLKENLSFEKLKQAFIEYEDVFTIALKPVEYTSIVFSTDSITAQNGVRMQVATQAYLDLRREMLFFELELADLSDKKITALSLDPVLSNYKHFLQVILDAKKHKLSEELEKVFNDKAITTDAFSRLFDQTFAKKKFKVVVNGQTQELLEEEILSLLENNDRDIRKAAADSFSDGLKEDEAMLSLIYNTLVKDKEISDSYRKFTLPEDSRHLSNEITKETVDALVEAVSSNFDVVSDFYRFKKKVMGLDVLEIYDRYAPMSKSELNYTYEEAKAIVLAAYKKFSPVFYDAASKFFENNWIDAEIRPGKRGGAYCSQLLPHLHPVVFMNYKGMPRDVKTLAHELGHGVNDYLMRKQTLLNYGVPLTLAETASVFGEMLVFDELKQRITNPSDKFDLYVDKIQSIFATVFRQIAMFEFEREVHNAHAKKGELTPQDLNKIWHKYQVVMFKDSINFEKKYDNWWSYIQHFIHSPFYVYAYAFGMLLVLSLYAQYKKDPVGFTPKYITLMESGSIASPQELLKPFGVNLSDKKFWLEGIDMIKDLILEAKQIHKAL